MNSKFDLKLQFANAALVAALTVAGSAMAQTLPKEGSYDITACFTGISNLIAYSKTHYGFSYETTGTNRSSPPGGMLDNTTFRCAGLNTSFGGKNTQTTLCEVVDRDGDKQLSYISTAADGTINREGLGGTGKYEGIQMSGKLVALGPFPSIKPGTFQACNHQTGSYKLK